MAILKIKSVPIKSFFEFDQPSDPVQLVDVINEAADKKANQTDFLNSHGYFVYETKFFIDEAKAKNLGIDSVNFKFYNEAPTSKSVPIEGGTFSIKLENNEEKPFFLGGQTGNSLGLKIKPSNVSEALIFSKSPGFESLVNVAPTMLMTSNALPLASTPFKLAAKNSETLSKKDPAASLAAGKSLAVTPMNSISFGNTNAYPQPDDKNFEKVGSYQVQKPISLKDSRTNLQKSRKGSQNSEILNSFASLPKITDFTSLTKKFPVIAVEIASKKQEYSRQLYFNKNALLGTEKIYLVVSANVSLKFKNLVEKKLFYINHGSEVRDFFGNPEPPIVQSSESSFGKMSIILKKSDPTLRKVKIIRITTNPNNLNPVIEKRATLDFGDNKDLFFEDAVDNVAPNVVIYRFIVQNDDGSYGEFSSLVLDSYTKIADQKKVESATTPISIRALNKKDYVQIAVDTLNDQVFSLRLLRQDMGAIGEFSDTIKTIYGQSNEYSTIVLGEKTTIEFLDFDTVPGRHYRYFAAYKLGQGVAASLQQESMSDEDEIIIRRQPVTEPIFKASLSAPSISQDSFSSITISFDMFAEETDDAYNTLFSALTSAGVGSQFLQDFQNDKQKIRQVAAFLVERVDRVTGKRIAFGIYPPGTFSDSPAERVKKGIAPPIPGRKYEYVCKLCIRPPESFLLTAFAGFTSRVDQPGNITQILAVKFQSALANFGIIPSEKTVRNGYSIRENFESGQVGVEISNTVKLPQAGAQIKNVEVKTRKFYNLISWNVVGDVSSVSYFLVYCNYNGVDELVGTVSSVGSNSSYRYKDERYCQEVGEKKYFVKVVTIDHDVSVQSSHVETITNFSLPSPVLDGYILSPSRNDVKGAVLLGPGPTLEKTSDESDGAAADTSGGTGRGINTSRGTRADTSRGGDFDGRTSRGSAGRPGASSTFDVANVATFSVDILNAAKVAGSLNVLNSPNLDKTFLDKNVLKYPTFTDPPENMWGLQVSSQTSRNLQTPGANEASFASSFTSFSSAIAGVYQKMSNQNLDLAKSSNKFSF